MLYGHYDTSSWYLSFKLVFPFDETTLLGWFSAWFIELNIAFTYAICMTGITSYFVCCCLYIVTMCEHFKLITTMTEREINKKKLQTDPHEILTTHILAKNLMIQAINLHNQIIE